MAALFDVVRSSTKFTGENTLLFPWRPQQEGCCHSKRQGSRRGPLALTEEHVRPGSRQQADIPTFQKSTICTASASEFAVESVFSFFPSGVKAAAKRCRKVKTSVLEEIETSFITGNHAEPCKNTCICLKYRSITACLHESDS